MEAAAKSWNAHNQLLPFSQALMQALKLITLASSLSEGMLNSTFKALVQAPIFSHALMAALQHTSLGATDPRRISLNNRRALKGCRPFSHALSAAP